MSHEENAEQKTDGRYALRGKIKDLYDLFMIEDVFGNVDMEASCKALHEALKTAEDGLREIRVPSQEELAKEANQDALLRALDFNENDKANRPFKQRWPQSERKLKFNEKRKRLELVDTDRSSQSMPHLLLIKELAESGFGGLDIVFEYIIPGTARRADAVIIGETTLIRSEEEEWKIEKKEYVLIIECKSWDSGNWGEGGFSAIYHPWTLCPDGDVRAFKKKDAPDRGFSETLHHPLFQALAYRNFLNNFHSEALNSNWWIASACFLPDVDTTSFLHCSTENFNEAECNAINDSVDNFAFNAAHQIASTLSGAENRTKVAPSKKVEEFLSGSFAIPADRKAERAINNICKATATSKTSKDTRLTDKQIEFLNSMIEDESKRIVVLPVPRDEEFNRFVSSADLAMSLQNALLHAQNATESISLQTNDKALAEIREAIETSKAYEEMPTVRYALNRLFIEKSMAFNVFNAYKWEPAVYTAVGIVDLCSWLDDQDERKTRKQAEDLDSLDAFLEKSTAAGTIFLLVDGEHHDDDENQKTQSKILDHLVAKYPKESVTRFDVYM